jgi:serine O-acetyltransferase
MLLLKDIQADFRTNEIFIGNLFFKFLRIFLSQRSWAIILLRIAISHLSIFSSIARIFLNFFFHIEIGAGVKIGPNLFMPHPTDIIIARGTEIGRNSSIYHRTTFAEKHGIHKGPKLGERCIVGTGTVIIGNIILGDNVSIGPNSVVINDIESNTIAFGNPLQIIAKVRQECPSGSR